MILLYFYGAATGPPSIYLQFYKLLVDFYQGRHSTHCATLLQIHSIRCLFLKVKFDVTRWRCYLKILWIWKIDLNWNYKRYTYCSYNIQYVISFKNIANGKYCIVYIILKKWVYNNISNSINLYILLFDYWILR